MTNLFVFILTWSFVQVISHNPRGSWTMKPNDGSQGWQPLTCLESQEEKLCGDNQRRDIYWRKKGDEKAERGNTYQVQLTESSGGGNYTCHGPDGSLLNHTEVLIQQVETNRWRLLAKTQQEEYIKCSAKNHGGDFHCSWTWGRGRHGRVAFIKAERDSVEKNTVCSVDPSNQQWMCSSSRGSISCFVENDGQGISCRDEQHCPYAEEIHQIHLTIGVRADPFILESYSKFFFLSEIVKPDKVQINKVNETMVEWTYPNSWNKPKSYFPLTFQILELKRRYRKGTDPCTVSNHTKNLTFDLMDICQYEVEQRPAVVCVRAKDAFCNSQWSEWSHFRLRKHKKKKKKNMEQTKKFEKKIKH